MPGLFHDASGKVAHEVRHVYIHACLHALEVAWGRGFVAHDLGVPARTLVRLSKLSYWRAETGLWRESLRKVCYVIEGRFVFLAVTQHDLAC